VVPSIARSQYDADGVAYDSLPQSSISSAMTITTSTSILSTTIVIPTLEDNYNRTLNGTVPKQTFRKRI
jgi:hypothetical protein